ncbi:hypothetical protein HAX54_046574 [Datura stramonium]|uniref:H(+)-transporting two-sector ATPase n=1 Tax=Datura stramonium TaxID=4076 RepID=A0ABS8SS56_DATST|nr:hypothetical protein [Datura stramonium]
MKESGVINEENIAESKVALVYGQMNEPPGARMRIGFDCPMAEYFEILMSKTYFYLLTISSVSSSRIRSIGLIGGLASKGIYPAVDPLDSTSTMLQPRIVGEEQYETSQRVKQTLQRYKELQDIIAILGLNELSKEDCLLVARGQKIERFLSQLFFVAEIFIGSPGK